MCRPEDRCLLWRRLLADGGEAKLRRERIASKASRGRRNVMRHLSLDVLHCFVGDKMLLAPILDIFGRRRVR